MRRPATGNPENAEADFFDTGKHGFTNGVPNVTAPTTLFAEQMNAVVGELSTAVELDEEIDDTRYDQLANVVIRSRRIARAQGEGTEILNLSGITVVASPALTRGVTCMVNTAARRLVVVGSGGGIYTSDAGGGSGSWTARTAAGGYVSQFNDVIGENGFPCVAVGQSGEIQSSADGTTWTQRVSGTAQEITRIASSSARLVAVALAGVTVTSTDGTTWSAGGTINGGNFAANAVVYVGGVWVASGVSAPTNRNTSIYRSTDNAATWAAVDLSSVLAADEYVLDVQASGGVLVAHVIGAALVSRTIYSLDLGLTWNLGGNGSGTNSMRLFTGDGVMGLFPTVASVCGTISFDGGTNWNDNFYVVTSPVPDRIQLIHYGFQNPALPRQSGGTRRWGIHGALGNTDQRGRLWQSRLFAS